MIAGRHVTFSLSDNRSQAQNNFSDKAFAQNRENREFLHKENSLR